MTDAASRLEGGVALVTGAGVRVGAAIAEALAGAGMDVVLHHHSSHEGALAVKATVEKLGRRAWLAEADFTDPAAAGRLVRDATRLAGPLAVVVNNASNYPPETLPETTDALLHRTLAINAWSPLAVTRAFAEAGGAGVVVNVLDTHLHHLTRKKFAYQLSKQALAWMTRATALEYAPRVRVNGVAPGAILPPPGEADGYLDRLGERLPLRRHGTPDDVTQAVLFLARAAFVTGVVVEVDGGEHLEGTRRV